MTPLLLAAALYAPAQPAADASGLALKGHTGFVYSAVFSTDGKKVVTASFDWTARVWDAATGEKLLILEGHTGGVGRATFSPDGKTILTASRDDTARVWDAESGKQLLALRSHKDDAVAGHPSGVHAARFSPDGKKIVTASGKTGRVWDAATGK
jgi:WD40 repeat protein